jgi:hypothetical protein
VAKPLTAVSPPSGTTTTAANVVTTVGNALGGGH